MDDEKIGGGSLVKKGDKLFIRIDYRNEENEFGPTDFEDHIDYLKSVASERYFIGGGFKNEKGGMIVFKAKDFEEAKRIADNDPLIKKDLYTYKLYEWELVIVSEKIQE